MSIRTRVPPALLVAVVALAGFAARADDTGPLAVIDGLHATFLDVMQQAVVLGYQGRYDRLAPVLQRHFDFDVMARSVLGSGWKDLPAADQQRWVRAFTQLTTATYAGRFKGYTGEQFRTLGQEPAAQDTVFVRTVIDRSKANADDVELTYRLRRTGDGWRVVDIYQKGTVSEIALRRSEYSAVLKRDGFTKLLEVVDAKIADYASGRAEL